VRFLHGIGDVVRCELANGEVYFCLEPQRLFSLVARFTSEHERPGDTRAEPKPFADVDRGAVSVRMISQYVVDEYRDREIDVHDDAKPGSARRREFFTGETARLIELLEQFQLCMRDTTEAAVPADQLYLFPSLLSKADPATISECWCEVSDTSISSSPPWGVRWLPENKNDHLTPGVLHRVMLAIWQSDFVKLGKLRMDRRYSNVCRLKLATCRIVLVMDDSVQLAQSPNALSMGVFPRCYSVEHQAEYAKALRWLLWLVHDAVHHNYHREVCVNNLCERCAVSWPIKCNNSENGGQVAEVQLHRTTPNPDQPLGDRLHTRYHDDVCILRLICMHGVDKYEPRGAYELLQNLLHNESGSIPYAPPLSDSTSSARTLHHRTRAKHTRQEVPVNPKSSKRYVYFLAANQ
jgi:hypothetical protein